MAMTTQMSEETLLELLQSFATLGVTIWLDGGWGVDALLGEQTRVHADVDIVVQQRELSIVVAFLRSRGYGDIARDDTRPWNFVLGDRQGNEVDIHVIDLNQRGDSIYGPPENGDMYPAPALTGIGSIRNRSVRCVTAEYQVANHAGYALREKDFQDVRRLCRRFGISVPEQFKG